MAGVFKDILASDVSAGEGGMVKCVAFVQARYRHQLIN